MKWVRSWGLQYLPAPQLQLPSQSRLLSPAVMVSKILHFCTPNLILMSSKIFPLYLYLDLDCWQKTDAQCQGVIVNVHFWNKLGLCVNCPVRLHYIFIDLKTYTFNIFIKIYHYDFKDACKGADRVMWQGLHITRCTSRSHLKTFHLL